MVSRFDFTLNSVEAVVVGRGVGVDVRVFPLRISNTTIEPDRFLRLAGIVASDLQERQLTTRGGLHPEVRRAFALIADHRVAVTASGTSVDHGDVTVYAVSDGAQALTIGQAPDEDTLYFTLLPDEEFVSLIAESLPPADPAPTRTLTVSRQAGRQLSAMAARRIEQKEFDEEETEAFGNLEVAGVIGSRGRRTPRRDADEMELDEILAGPRLGGGYFTATGRTRHGERRTTAPVSWLDVESGRYLVHTTDESGTFTARYVPAGFSGVTAAVQGLISAVY